MNELLTMNGYGIYVWSAYSISIASILYIFVQTQYKLNKVKKKTQKGFHNVP